ncbi:MAG: transcription-repair coupling factor, partial [Bryobacterales bacterium]|nr:transcription-repair coupling factor [Bryobacterales bacterium]
MLQQLDSGPLSLSGLTATAKALYAVLLWQLTERPLVIITGASQDAENLQELAATFFDLLIPGRDWPRPQLLPALDVLPWQSLAPHAEITEQRAIGLWRLASGPVPVTVAPVASALLRTARPDYYRQLALNLRTNEEVPLEDLLVHLRKIGYERREPVEMVGEYSVRGGILDVFSPESAQPVRLEFYGDLIESIRRFDPQSQRSVLKVEDCLLLPLADGTAGTEVEMPGSLFEMLSRPVVLLDEPEQIEAEAARLWDRIESLAPGEEDAGKTFHRWDELNRRVLPAARVHLRELGLASEPDFHVATRPSLAFHGNMRAALGEARTLVESGSKVVFFAESAGEVERLADIFNEYELPYQLGVERSSQTPQYLAERAYLAGAVASIYLVRGNVRRGTFFVDSGLAVFGSEDLFDTSELVARPAGPASRLGAFSTDLFDLKPGDFVVHAEHGVGRFLGLREIEQGEARGDYMVIEYSGGAKLYVPLSRMDLIQRFRGAGEAQPGLDRLGGATWTRTKSRVKARMRDMAEELLKLYAQRKLAEGFLFSADSNWQREFEEAFEYTETRDQITAIQEIKRDMESPQPMDRLLCGDVGFGKTEVVMRAAFKALGDGKQVAVLAPTTVLAFQHFETFRRRFQPFPVRVEMLSRFVAPKDVRAVLADLAEGKVDIAVGTHRLLSADVHFRDLGLVIIDEEQRFGVKHKEKLKQLRQSVDVVAMSATPIPRTLHMSLLGLRDMSVIETPPKDRLAIQTQVAHYNPELIKSAIELELGRGGQVYLVHNRVETIWERAASIQELVPQARIGVGHGQMDEALLEKTILKFMRHEYDVFVSTTIVENGLDIPLANTIIIENAERYGLSDLYQLRGRVGRSNRRAYAYLLVPPHAELSPVARKRLAALKEFSELGAGFKIAALDLELRGAGNLLGGEQHGHINSVGFDMYVRLLEETVRELKGEEVVPEIHSSLNLGLDIRIPSAYISDENQRLRAYRRIASTSEPARLERELEDRYGPVPDAVRSLLEYSALKALAERLRIEAIDRKHAIVNIKFHQQTRISPERLMALVDRTPGAQFTPAGVLRLPLDGTAGASAVLARVKTWL